MAAKMVDISGLPCAYQLPTSACFYFGSQKLWGDLFSQAGSSNGHSFTMSLVTWSIAAHVFLDSRRARWRPWMPMSLFFLEVFVPGKWATTEFRKHEQAATIR